MESQCAMVFSPFNSPEATSHNGDSRPIVQGEGLSAMTAALTLGVEIGDDKAVEHQYARERLAAARQRQVAIAGRDRTTLQLASPLTHVYARATVGLNANVAWATHGGTVASG